MGKDSTKPRRRLFIYKETWQTDTEKNHVEKIERKYHYSR